MNKLFAVSFIVAFFSGAVFAQDSMPSFEEVDADGDSNVSQQELQDANVQGVDVTMADQDQDGVLSKEEYEQASQSGASQ